MPTYDKYGRLRTTNQVTVITGNLNQKSITVEQPSDSEKIAIFYTTLALEVKKIIGVVKGTSPSVTYNIVYDSDINSAGTNVTNAPVAVTDVNSGVDAVLDNPNIPAGSWVWFITTANSGTIVWINATIEF